MTMLQSCSRSAIIGAFHFGAFDHGMFHTGLRATKSQADRTAAYQDYVRGALKNRYLVGTYWFQFGDQATTGRFDGENYQIGFVDACDTPYPELIHASREIGTAMYRLRAGGEQRPSITFWPTRRNCTPRPQRRAITARRWRTS